MSNSKVSAQSWCVRRKKQEHLTIPEVVQILIVPPAERSDRDCESIAEALFEFISSIPAFKEGALIVFVVHNGS